MSDFLSALLDRATGQLPVLERRRAALFEPEPSVEAALPFPEAPLPQESAGHPQPFEARYIPSSALPAAETRAVPVVVRERVSSPADAFAPETAPDRRPTEVKTVEREHTLTERTVEVRTEAQQQPLLRVERIVEHRPMFVPAIREAAEAPRQPEMRSRQEPLLKPAMPAPSAVRPNPQETKAPERRQQQPVFPGPARQPVAVRRPLSVPRAPEQPAPEPTIHVTIGRVEIRAASTPASVPPVKPAGPKLKLDEYLRARNGGGR